MTTPVSTPPESPASGATDIEGPIVLSPEDLQSTYGLNPPDMNYMCSLCFFCYDPPNKEALIFCSICKARQYCSEECREMDWRWHEHRCPGGEVLEGADMMESLAEEWGAGDPAPPHRSRMRQNSITERLDDEVDQAQTDLEWFANQPLAREERGRKIWHYLRHHARDHPKKEESIYYLRLTMLGSGSKKIAGPYVHQQVVIDKVHQYLAMELCRKGRRRFQRVIDQFGFINFTEFSFDLPSGDSVKLDLIEETNRRVAKLLHSRSRRRHSPHVYRLDCAYVASTLGHQTHTDGERPPDVYNTLGTFLTKERANRQGQEIVETWKEEMPFCSWDQGLIEDGLYLGVVEGWAKDRKVAKVKKIILEDDDSGRLRPPGTCERSESVPPRRRAGWA